MLDDSLDLSELVLQLHLAVREFLLPVRRLAHHLLCTVQLTLHLPGLLLKGALTLVHLGLFPAELHLALATDGLDLGVEAVDLEFETADLRQLLIALSFALPADFLNLAEQFLLAIVGPLALRH